MLSDTDRKVLRILFNIYRNNWSRPDLDQLCRLSGRPPQQVRAAVKTLIQERYVELDRQFVRVVRAWEETAQPQPVIRNYERFMD